MDSQYFDPPRLTLARDLRGLTKVELAEMVYKTASAISQFESGRARPDIKTLAKLALAIGVPREFFAARPGSRRIHLEECHFRSLRSASQRDRRQLLALGSLLCEVVSHLEQYVDFPVEQITDVSATVSSTEEIEELAISIRRAWNLGLGPVSHMLDLLEGKGVLVLPVAEECRKVDAFSVWHEGRPCVFVLLKNDQPTEMRWKAAHELGHLVMHADVTPGLKQLERQAERFAAALLLPRESFLPECPRRLDWPRLVELKKRWKVSLATLLYRAHELGNLSDASYRRGFVYLNQTNQRRNEQHEPPMESPSMLGQALDAVRDELSTEALAATVGIKLDELKLLAGRE